MGKEPAARQAVPILGVASAAATLLGVLAVHAWPALPARWVDGVVMGIGLVMLVHPRLRLLGCVLVGFAWCAFRADVALDARLPRALEGRDVTVVGVIDALPIQRPDASRFSLRIEQAELDGAALPLRGLLRLSWYGEVPEGLAACGRWQLRVRLKRPRGLINRGGFDSERSALERGVVAVGYVRDEESNRRVGKQAWCIDRTRESISRGIADKVTDPHDAALLAAFAVGDTRGLDQSDWEIARANGITHLISISGFHVGVAAAFGALLIHVLWWIWPRLGLYIAFPIAQAPAALITAILYGFLAGGSLPTVRTVLMIAVVALTRFGRRASSGPHALALALLAILVFDPLATLSAGFWLSFVGVAFLMLCLSRGRGIAGFLRELSMGQLVMTVSLLPLTVWFFGEASLVGALSNLIAVPLVSFVIVPLCLLGILALLGAPVLATPILVVAGWVTHAQWWLLQQTATWPGAHWYLPEVAPWALVPAMLGAVWLFSPRGIPARALGALLFLPLLWPHRPPPDEGAFEAIVIDVGQGLSVLVRTHGHSLLFDAGARYPSDFDLGQAAVLPTLHALGVDRLDTLMVSHGDNDHAGGAVVVTREYPDAARIGGEPVRSPVPLAQCREGQRWEWDAVRFRVINPTAPMLGEGISTKGNNLSCVVLVEGMGGRLLLTGDIDSRVETEVVRRIGRGPPLVLLAAHHGSRSSSSAGFIEALQPQFAIVSAAWRSRFGHPHPQVVQRYADADVPLWNTADGGALTIRFPADADPLLISRERERQRRYWRE